MSGAGELHGDDPALLLNRDGRSRGQNRYQLGPLVAELGENGGDGRGNCECVGLGNLGAWKRPRGFAAAAGLPPRPARGRKTFR